MIRKGGRYVVDKPGAAPRRVEAPKPAPKRPAANPAGTPAGAKATPQKGKE